MHMEKSSDISRGRRFVQGLGVWGPSGFAVVDGLLLHEYRGIVCRWGALSSRAKSLKLIMLEGEFDATMRTLNPIIGNLALIL